jgi:2-haloacid dehalogenase
MAARPETRRAPSFHRAPVQCRQCTQVKPAPEVYLLITELLNVPPSAICLVAAHIWDTLGAQSVGFSAGFVARTGNAALPVSGLPRPDVIAPDLTQMAHQMIAL